MNVINPGIIQDISLLYELSLSIGKSQSLKENCDLFLTTLMRRTNLNSASIWIQSSYVSYIPLNTNSYQLVFTRPAKSSQTFELEAGHPLIQALEGKEVLIISQEDPLWEVVNATEEQDTGGYAIFKLGEVGILKLHANTGSRLFEKSWHNRIRNVFEQFTHSLLSNIAHQRILWEVEERRVVEAQLIQAREAEEQFFANMSHEIRTPLNGMLGMMNLILETDLSIEQKEYINDMKVASKTLLAVLNDILDFSKIKQGKIDIERIKFELHDNLRSLYHIARTKGREKGVKVNLLIDFETPKYVMGDPVRLNQILENLINNALKFTPEGEVNIHMKMIQEVDDAIQMEFQIQDTGIGIPKDKQAHIFKQFTQASSDTARKFGGTGLGLPIVKQLLELMSGQIQIESEVGAGTTFTIQLPFGVIDQSVIRQPQVSTHKKEEKPNLSGNRILVVEDTFMNQKVIQRMLKNWGAEVSLASNGIEGLAALANESFDLILMDVHMPQMDGYEATSKIREEMEAPVNKIPIIALTASVRATVKRKVLEVGMDGYIIKPFEPENLYKVIRFYLNKRRLQIQSHRNQAPDEFGRKEIDQSYLLRISNGDTGFVKDMMKVFGEQIPIELEYMGKSIDQTNWSIIVRQAHKMKYPFSSMGRNDLRLILTDIEKEAEKQGNITQVRRLYEELKNETHAMLNFLKETKESKPD